MSSRLSCDTDDGVLTAELPPISIEGLNVTAALQKRTDRKYLIDHDTYFRMLDENCRRFAVLDMDGRRTFGYQSVYFDNASFDSYRGAAQRRRRRFKVRTRTYLDTATTMLEVKTKDGRGQTVKARRCHDGELRQELGNNGLAFVSSIVDHKYLTQRFRPISETQYSRSTLFDVEGNVRVRIDKRLCCKDWTNSEVVFTGQVIVETKSGGGPSATDRWLWRQGVRPVRFSKFGTSLAMLHPELPSNKWHRTIRRYFGPAADLASGSVEVSRRNQNLFDMKL